MVTSNKPLDQKVVKMAEPNNNPVVPQRTLLGEVNEHITCPLCRGYYIDATTIVECLHSFCRSCIIKHLKAKSYCPVCEMMINSAKPNIKLDKALQDIVYKLVPGLFQKEMERRQQFYASRPGHAASATPEQRGEDTERIIFSPEDVISFSLEFTDVTDTDSISSKSSDSNESQQSSAITRRYLQCPAVVNVSHLKKFLSMKFDIDHTQFSIDISYKRVPLPDYYTLMDIAYIYNWKRNEPMRFFYQIIDYIAIRNRIFDISRKGNNFPEAKTNINKDGNAAANAYDLGSELSSGTDSPTPYKNLNENKLSKTDESNKGDNNDSNVKTCKKNEEVEKSQFLNSFELTAKSNQSPNKDSPKKVTNTLCVTNEVPLKSEDSLKRRPPHANSSSPELKKVKVETEQTKSINQESLNSAAQNITKSIKTLGKTKDSNSLSKLKCTSSPVDNIGQSVGAKGISNLNLKLLSSPTKNMESSLVKRNMLSSPSANTTKPLTLNDNQAKNPKSKAESLLGVSSKNVAESSGKPTEQPKTPLKKMPELRSNIHPSLNIPQKLQPVNKLRMDLLANNSDPTIDRSKILSQVKTTMSTPHVGQPTGDPLKSLFDSCKINIPSSLSITLTDQKSDPNAPAEIGPCNDQKRLLASKPVAISSTILNKPPLPPVHNYIEILKIPDTNKVESLPPKDGSLLKNPESPNEQKVNKAENVSTKGPVPNLKPIADTKLSKSATNACGPITFQQTFEKQLQAIQTDKKPKLPKSKGPVPNLVPTSHKTLNSVAKTSNNSIKGPNTSDIIPNKISTALDLSTPFSIKMKSQLGPQQTKAFETMQTIANLARKQNLSPKVLPGAVPQNNVMQNVSRSITANMSPMRFSTAHMKLNTSGTMSGYICSRPELPSMNSLKPSESSPLPIANYQIPSHSSPTIHQSPRSQTRSPSSSPKLVIAEEKNRQ